MKYLVFLFVILLAFYYLKVAEAFLWNEIKTKKQLLLYLVPFYTVIEKIKELD